MSNPKSHARNKANLCDGRFLYDPYEGIPIQNYANHIAKLGLQGLFEEYFHIAQVDQNCTHPTVKAFRKHHAKNRYKDIPCIDETRVILDDDSVGSPSSSPQRGRDRKPEKSERNDYIHANFVDGFKHKRAYICTQGPMVGTTNDLWRMVWQENVLVIVMLTKCVEANNEKCSQYWPIVERKIVRCGSLTIQNQDTRKQNDFQITRLLVTHSKFQKSRILHHMQYLQWPDHGTPECSLGFHRFLDEMNLNQAKSCTITENIDQWNGCTHGPPIAVHCSAGIGRTGTLLALDIQRKKLAETGLVDVSGCVRAMRKQRWMSVQKPEQYAFLSLALLEFAHGRNLIEGLNINRFLKELVQNCLSMADDDESANKCMQVIDTKKKKERRKEHPKSEGRSSSYKQNNSALSLEREPTPSNWDQYRKLNSNHRTNNNVKPEEKSILLRESSSSSDSFKRQKKRKKDSKSRSRARSSKY